MRRLVVVLLLSSCGGPAPPAMHCVPGEKRACACPFGVLGSYQCGSDGTSFGACGGCNGQPAALSDLAKACAIESSCLAAPLAEPAGHCASLLQVGLIDGGGSVAGPSLGDLLRCASKATDCVGALDCATQGHGPAYCMAHAGESCDGDLRITCPAQDWPLLGVVDCAALGMHCASANGSTSCTDGSACDPSGPGSCEGNFWIACDAVTKLRSVTECGAIGPGFVCSMQGCAPPGASCTNASSGRCEGDRLVTCQQGAELSTDCTLLQAHCAAGACVYDNSACDQATSADRCNAGALELCVNDHWVDVACDAIGFMTCGAVGIVQACRN